jgi:hypothetical protein
MSHQIIESQPRKIRKISEEEFDTDWKILMPALKTQYKYTAAKKRVERAQKVD